MLQKHSNFARRQVAAQSLGFLQLSLGSNWYYSVLPREPLFVLQFELVTGEEAAGCSTRTVQSTNIIRKFILEPKHFLFFSFFIFLVKTGRQNVSQFNCWFYQRTLVACCWYKISKESPILNTKILSIGGYLIDFLLPLPFKYQYQMGFVAPFPKLHQRNLSQQASAFTKTSIFLVIAWIQLLFLSSSY